MNRYLKFVAQVAATAIAGLIAALVDDRVDFTDWLNVGVLALGSVAVLGAGNLPSGVWAHTKALVAAASAVLVLWQSLASGGMTTSEWLQLAVAALGAVGVFSLPGPRVYDAEHLGRVASGLADGPR